jgi:hypothetical protein
MGPSGVRQSGLAPSVRPFLIEKHGRINCATPTARSPERAKYSVCSAVAGGWCQWPVETQHNTAAGGWYLHPAYTRSGRAAAAERAAEATSLAKMEEH